MLDLVQPAYAVAAGFIVMIEEYLKELGYDKPATRACFEDRWGNDFAAQIEEISPDLYRAAEKELTRLLDIRFPLPPKTGIPGESYYDPEPEWRTR